MSFSLFEMTIEYLLNIPLMTACQCLFPMPLSIAASSEMLVYCERKVTMTATLMTLQHGTRAFHYKRERETDYPALTSFMNM